MDEKTKPPRAKKESSAPAPNQSSDSALRDILRRIETRAFNSEYLQQLLQKALADQERIEKSFQALVERKDSQIELITANQVEAERQVEELQGKLETERLNKAGLLKLIDDSLAQLGDLEKRQRDLQGSWAEFAAEREKAIDEKPQLDVLQKSLVDAEEKLAFTRDELANLAARFSQKLQKIAELEDDYAALSRQRAQEVTQLKRAILAEQKAVAQRARDLAAIRRSLQWRLRTKLVDIKRQLWRLAPPQNPLFDSAFYLDEYPDVRASGIDPYVHYLRHGILEGRNPHPLFDTDWYLERNSDVLRSGIDPLLHYYRFGAAEGRDPHPMFDNDWYRARNPDVRNSGINPLLHYCRHGAAENRDPHPQFSVARYLEQHPELRGQGINIFRHYLRQAATQPK